MIRPTALLSVNLSRIARTFARDATVVGWLALLSSPATARDRVLAYFEAGGGRIYIGTACQAGKRCAIADETISPEFEDAILFWEEAGDGIGIVFYNHRFVIRKRMDSMKIEIITTDSPDPSGSESPGGAAVREKCHAECG